MSPTMLAVNCLIAISLLFNTACVSALPISNSRVERGVDKTELLKDAVLSSGIAQQITSSEKLGVQIPEGPEANELKDMIKTISQFYVMKEEVDSKVKNTTETEEMTQFEVLSGMMELILDNNCNYLMDKMDDEEFKCSADQIYFLVAKMKVLEMTKKVEKNLRVEGYENGISYYNPCTWIQKYVVDDGSSSVESLKQFMKKNKLYIHCR